MFTKDEENSIKEFCNQYHQLYCDHHIFKILFEDHSNQGLLKKTAHTFFFDLNRIIHAHLLIQFCRLTDPKKTMGEENLTVEYLVKNIQWPSDTKKKLSSIHDKLLKFRSYIIDARNKILAHIDLDITRSKGVLGKFRKGKDVEFLNLLQEFCDCMHRACFGTLFGSISPGITGDVLDLLKALRQSLAFEKLWAQSSGEDLIKLVTLLDSVTENEEDKAR